jgi:hypothetical protein
MGYGCRRYRGYTYCGNGIALAVCLMIGYKVSPERTQEPFLRSPMGKGDA